MHESLLACRRFCVPFMAGLAIRVVASWLSHGEPLLDVHTFWQWAGNADSGRDPYSAANYPANYPPPWIYACWVCLKLSNWLGLSFDLVLKLMVSFCDSVTVIAVGLLAPSLGATESNARTAAWWYAMNPVAILISSFHAQNDAVVMGLVLWAVWLLVSQPIRNSTWIGMFLVGISLSIKPIAMLYLPILWGCVRPWSQRLLAAGVTMAPGIGFWLPHLVHAPGEVVAALTSYRGPPDLGYVGILNSWWNLGIGGEGTPIIESLPGSVRWLSLAACLAAWWMVRNLNLVEQLLFFTLSIYVAYGTIGAQYFVWFVPFAAALRSPRFWRCSVFAAATLFAFYQLKHPGILSGISNHRLPMGITIPQWSGLLLFMHVLLYVDWCRWLHAIWSEARHGGRSGLLYD